MSSAQLSGLLGDPSRDDYLTDFGKATLTDRYLFTGETYQDLFIRVACAYADGPVHAQALYDYMSRGWFMPATPILSNGGLKRGLPISCFLNAVPDSLNGIESTWSENVGLAAKGGGIGTYWGDVREIGAEIDGAGQTSGIIPFIKVQDSLTLAVSQGSLRRGSAAVYLDVQHPEIEEFLSIRKPTGGDINRKCLNVHHGVVITDEFMEAVAKGKPFDLISPKTGKVVKQVNARDLFSKILEMRVELGEPYILFIDNVNKALPKVYQMNGLRVKQSNLCSEIMLHTGPDKYGHLRTAVCCLSSVNAAKFHEWSEDEEFIENIMRFLDNVLQDFIDRTADLRGFERARYSAIRERSVGLGLMGFHTFLQQNLIPFESVMAKVWNKKIFKHLRVGCDAASLKLGAERGPCPDAQDAGLTERFAHKMAIAPTSSISIICGGVSAGVEPIPANIYTHKTKSGSFSVRNPNLERLLEEKGHNTDEVWLSIIENEGSVQHLTKILDKHERDVFKTFMEIDQRWVVDLAVDRTEEIDQGQSVNMQVPADISKKDLVALHVRGWKGGLKSFYYLRSKALTRAENISTTITSNAKATDDECLSCQ